MLQCINLICRHLSHMQRWNMFFLLFSVGCDHCWLRWWHSDYPRVCPHLPVTWTPPTADPDCSVNGKPCSQPYFRVIWWHSELKCLLRSHWLPGSTGLFVLSYLAVPVLAWFSLSGLSFCYTFSWPSIWATKFPCIISLSKNKKILYFHYILFTFPK